MANPTWRDIQAATHQMTNAELDSPFCAGVPGGEIIPVISMLRLPVARPVCDSQGMPLGELPAGTLFLSTVATCRHCGCTDDDCSQCMKRTEMPCSWVSPDECSACVSEKAVVAPIS